MPTEFKQTIPRGAESVARFSQHMLQTLNLPKNSCKMHWSQSHIDSLRMKLVEQYRETCTEISNLNQATTPTQKAEAALRLQEEAIDLANTAMMLYDHASTFAKES